MLIRNFCLIGGGEYPGKVCDIGFETHDMSLSVSGMKFQRFVCFTIIVSGQCAQPQCYYFLFY